MKSDDNALMLDFGEEISSLRARMESQQKPRRIWAKPSPRDFADGSVIGVDQSLGATGVVVLHKEGSSLRVLDAQVFPALVDPLHTGGHELNLRKATVVYTGACKYFSQIRMRYPALTFTLVHEAPPTGGGSLRNPDSSLLASLAIRLANIQAQFQFAPMVSAQDHHYLCCGTRLATKVQAHDVLKRWGPDVIEDFHLITNGAKRDALAVGLYHLWRENDVAG